MTFHCARYGQEWPDHPATLVPCPTCHIPAGAWCRRPSGHRVWGAPHVDRERTAMAVGFLTRCPAADAAEAEQLRLI